MTKILLIEDNPEMRENIAEILELSNYEVLTAENGKVGVELAKTHRPDLIICDIMMPELDGYGVLRILGKLPETAGIPFIFLTAKAEKTDFRKGMKMGADDYLTKPFEEVELMDAIELRLRKSKSLQQAGHAGGGEKLGKFLGAAQQQVRSLAELAERRQATGYKKKQVVFSEGSYPHEVFFIKTGKIKLYKTNADGKEYITDLLGPGDFMGHLAMLENSKHQESAMVMEEAEITRLSRDDFSNLLHENRDVAAQFIKLLSNNIQEKEARLLQLAYSSVRQRVADALLLLRERYQEPGNADPFSMTITRDDLASIVGTATESLIRTLSDFKDERLVEVNGGRITLLDVDKLKRVGS
jgi:CRP-like cAMP-binding protein/ActR/RegA family two-component response regulator